MALKSTNGGSSFAPIDLKFDARADVRSVHLASPDSVYLTGGGGFVRLSTDGGHTWTFQKHAMQAGTTDIFFSGLLGWATSSKNRIVIYTLDGGNYWRVPTNTNIGRSWSKKVSLAGQARGNTFAMNGTSRSLYCTFVNQVLKSLDEGETWSQIATLPASVNRTNAFLVSPKDSLVMLAATKSSTVGPRVYRSDDGGASWDTTSSLNFSEYGPPLEMHPDKPDTVYFGVDGYNQGLHRSTDFGATWSLWTNPSFAFRSPCDIQVVPDSSNIIIVGDGVTGTGVADFFKSTDGGVNFTLRQSGTGSASEIPGLATSRLKNSTMFATMWSGGGIRRSISYGDTFPPANGSATSMWGIDVSRDDPNCAIAGQYSGGFMNLTLDGTLSSTTHIQTTVSGGGNNYAFLVPDRSQILNMMSDGIYKMNITYAYSPVNGQSLNLMGPAGGEVWASGTNHSIFWSSVNLGLARIEYQTGPGQPWKLIADVPGYASNYSWSVPYDATSQARVRVRDAWDSTPADSSNAFTISGPVLQVTPPSLAFGTRFVSTSTQLVLTVQNTGNAALTVSSIETGASALAGTGPILASGGSAYTPGRTTLSLGPGQSDTLGVVFSPSEIQSYPDSLVLTGNAGPPRSVPLSGAGTDTLHLDLVAPLGGESWPTGTQHSITWSSGLVNNVAIEYKNTPNGPYYAIVGSVPAVPRAYAWTVPNDPTNSARVRIRQVGGPAADSSTAFSITGAKLMPEPNPLDLTTPATTWVTEELIIENQGTSPLVITNVTDNHPSFYVTRTSFTIAAGQTDTLGVTYHPTTTTQDTALLTIVSNDVSSPTVVTLHGHGTSPVDVGTGAPPVSFALSQNRPNPFSRSTRIAYALPVAATVRIDVFNLQGQRVATLVDGQQPAGNHTVTFGRGAATVSGERLGAIPAGVYFYRFHAGSFAATRKMLVLQ